MLYFDFHQINSYNKPKYDYYLQKIIMSRFALNYIKAYE